MHRPIPEETERIASEVLNASFAVHSALGPGLLESVYEKCLAYELDKRGIKHKTQLEVPIKYDGHCIDANLRIDLLVESQLIVELKSVDQLLPIHDAQLLTYLRITNLRLGLLLNFNNQYLKSGIKRIVL